MANKKYEFIEHTADIGVRAFGRNPEEVFINSASGMFAIIADTRRIKPKEQVEIRQKAAGYDELLRQWLAELLYQFNASGIIFKEFIIRSLSQNAIEAIARGENMPDKIKTEIKAVTYHELAFKKTKDGYEAKVIFDV
jgi:SHS2 domain-containing protein